MKSRKCVALCMTAVLSLAMLAGCGSGSGAASSGSSAQTQTEVESSSASETESSTAAETESSIQPEAESSSPEENGGSLSSEAESSSTSELADGTYTVDVTTGSSMFHVNEADDGKGVLTVENGKMSVHIRLASKKIVNVFYGTAEEAQEEGAELIEPTTDVVTYDDGMEEEVYGFDIPVPAIDEEFDVAIIGTHGNWYTHQMKVSNPQPADA